jgi:predicted HD phosphohydrolase
MIKEKSMKYDERHGGPYDRGGADSYYRRPFRPHYFAGATYQSTEHVAEKGTPEYEAYKAGFDENETSGSFKY